MKDWRNCMKCSSTGYELYYLFFYEYIIGLLYNTYST